VTLPIVAGGRAVSWLIGTRLLGVHRAPLPALSVVAATATVAVTGAIGAPIWLSGILAWQSLLATLMVPWVPSRIGFHFLTPITLGEIGVDSAEDRAIYARVTGALQAVMDG